MQHSSMALVAPNISTVQCNAIRPVLYASVQPMPGPWGVVQVHLAAALPA
jgi:hypothetical protein